MRRLLFPGVLAVLAPSAAGHGMMTWPPSRARSDQSQGSGCGSPDRQTNGTCFWFQQGCSIGCEKCSGDPTCGAKALNCCGAKMKPTLNDVKFRTFLDVVGLQAACRNSSMPGSEAACAVVENAGCDKDTDEPCDTSRYNPWRAPGFAGLDSPCGLAGGGKIQDLQTGCQPVKVAGKIYMGNGGEELPVYKTVEWPAGSVQEVSWGFVANHGGGYAYRLCPASEKPTEECFQRGHLQFVGEQSWIQKKTNKGGRKAISATRVTEGTNPPGSMWTKNPIPPCDGPYGGAQHCLPAAEGSPATCDCSKPQWDPPLPGLWGFGAGHCAFPDPRTGGERMLCSPKELLELERNFGGNNYVDTVQVPADLPKGDYMISFRWDGEQTPQIWATCGDIRIT